jgi:hypothetical protein
MSVDKTIIFLEASQFGHDIGDVVRKGTILGVLKSKPVVAPFDSVIQSVSFDSEEHLLTVVLVEVKDS